MILIPSGRVGILSGEVTMFDHFADETPMWNESGRRTVEKRVVFDNVFIEAPSVTCAIAMIDHDATHNLRLTTRVERITETEFWLVAGVWQNTRVARLCLSWQAIGAVEDPDDFWDV